VKVEVQLFATLARYLPAGAIGDSVTLDVAEGTRVGDIIGSLDLPGDLECVRVVNGRDAPFEHLLADGDIVSLFPPLAGGSQAAEKGPSASLAPAAAPALTSAERPG
jgi:sulfur-carrier protein